MDSNNSYLGTEKLGKLLAKFAIPCTLSLIINALYNIVDQIFIGNSRVGAIGNTATTIIFPLTCLALAIALMFGDGTAAYMSICMGRKDTEKLSKSVANSILAALTISLLYVLFGNLFLSQILKAIGAKTPEALEHCIEYGKIIIIGFPFFILGAMFNGIIRADGRPQLAMASLLTGAITNIILDAIFVFPLDMGLTGAALATIIGQILSFSISLFFVLKAKTFRLSLKDFKPNFEVLSWVVRLGISSFMTQLAIVVVTIVSNNIVAKYGAESKYGVNDPQAIIGCVMKVFSIFLNVTIGISVGAQPIVGYNYGAKNYDRVKGIYKIVVSLALVVGLVGTFLFEVFPQAVIGIFGSNTANPELYKEFGIKTVRIFLMFFAFTSIQKASGIFLQSIGKPIKATLLSLTRDVFAIIPLTIILPIFMGLEGVLWAAPIADLIGIILTIVFVITTLNQLNRPIKKSEFM